uniref:Uncharacterized protein n=1 Tax=uncultured marine virus TaxID=186617 RepID=A0A0F7L6T9_9VIRU|nr:hypothetical protein [uncultured marine virus]
MGQHLHRQSRRAGQLGHLRDWHHRDRAHMGRGSGRHHRPQGPWQHRRGPRSPECQGCEGPRQRRSRPRWRCPVGPAGSVLHRGQSQRRTPRQLLGRGLVPQLRARRGRWRHPRHPHRRGCPCQQAPARAAARA